MSDFRILRSENFNRFRHRIRGANFPPRVLRASFGFVWALVGVGLAISSLFPAPTVHAQNDSAGRAADCRQWMVTVFSANFPTYVPLDELPWPEDSLRYASVSLPPDWEPLLVQGGFSALVPAKRCLEWQ